MFVVVCAAVRCLLFAVRLLLLFVCNVLCVVWCFGVRCLLCVVCCLLFVVRCLLLVA